MLVSPPASCCQRQCKGVHAGGKWQMCVLGDTAVALYAIQQQIWRGMDPLRPHMDLRTHQPRFTSSGPFHTAGLLPSDSCESLLCIRWAPALPAPPPGTSPLRRAAVWRVREFKVVSLLQLSREGFRMRSTPDACPLRTPRVRAAMPYQSQ